MDGAGVGNWSQPRCVIWRGRLAGEGLLLVVELDVRLVEQGDIKAECEVAGRSLREREAGVPAVQVALQANEVSAELPRVEIVVGVPGRRPMCRRLKRESESHLLTPRAAADESRVHLWAGPYSGVVERQVESLAPAARQRRRPRKLPLTEPGGDASRGALGSGGRWGGRGLAGAGAPPQTEQGGDAADRRRANGELGRDVRQERIELRRVGAHLTFPQVVRHGQPEAREQVRSERVADRSRLPARMTGLLRLLEVVGQRARVDAQEPNLPRRLLGRVARRWLELSLEVLRQAEADRLLGIAARGEVPARRIERVREGRVDAGPRGISVTDQRRNRMADPGDRPDPWQEPEEGGTEARVELEPLALPQKLPVRELVADHERPLRCLVHDRDARLELPGSREQRREVDSGLPVDGGTERLVEEHPAAPARDGRVGDVELQPLVADVVGHVETVGPVPGPDAERCLKAQGRGAVVEEQGVHGPAGEEHRRLALVECLLIAEGKPGRPGDGGRDVDRGRRKAHRRYGLRYQPAPDLLPPVAADAERP